VHLPLPPPTDLVGTKSTDWSLAGARLTGSSAPERRAQSGSLTCPGDRVMVTLEWQAGSTANRDARVGLSLVDQRRGTVANDEREPLLAGLPPTEWLLWSAELPLPRTASEVASYDVLAELRTPRKSAQCGDTARPGPAGVLLTVTDEDFPGLQEQLRRSSPSGPAGLFSLDLISIISRLTTVNRARINWSPPSNVLDKRGFSQPRSVERQQCDRHPDPGGPASLRVCRSGPRGRPKARFCPLDETAAHLGASMRTIYRLSDSKQFPHSRIGNVLRCDLPTVSG